MHKLQNEVPHADIAGYITAALATGMSAIEDGPRASAEAAALAEAEPLSQEDMAANEGDRLYDMENGK